MSPTCFEPRGFILRETAVYAEWYVLYASVGAIWQVGECVRVSPTHKVRNKLETPESETKY